MDNIITTLQQRGFVSHISDPGLAEVLAQPRLVYAGFDATGQSLHIGHLLQIMLLMQFQRHGHRPIALLGGATAMIGDPSGKSEERNLLSQETIEQNVAGIQRQLEHFLDFDGPNGAILVNNADWIGQFTFLEFLRDVGKHFRVGEMMGKESVRQRLQSETGMSFTEFSYQMLQAYDFLHLSRQYDCIVQTGGDDQWGNITAGIDLTRKIDARSVYGITSPLITNASGQKFGKTAAGTNCWLDPDMTSPYEFYQYCLRTDDRDVIKLLQYFTFLPGARIDELAQAVQQQPEKRQAQQVLAEEVTSFLHGPEQLATAQQASQVLFGQEVTGLSDRDLRSIFADVPSTEIPKANLVQGIPLIDALCQTNLCASRGDAKKLLKGGGAYVNNVRVTVIDQQLTVDSLASESILVLRTGKKNYHLMMCV